MDLDFLKFLAEIAGTGLAAWSAIRVEVRWLRTDVNRAHSRLNDHDKRIRKLEIH
jgi:hypothetical protein